jgi:hypothetical protein
LIRFRKVKSLMFGPMERVEEDNFTGFGRMLEITFESGKVMQIPFSGSTRKALVLLDRIELDDQKSDQSRPMKGMKGKTTK